MTPTTLPGLQAMKTEHQSPGYYTYTCENQNCWYCEMMHPKIAIPIPRKYTRQFTYIAENWDSMSIRDIGLELNISKRRIQQIAKRLKLPNKKRCRSR
jgi:hypothetical protein